MFITQTLVDISHSEALMYESHLSEGLVSQDGLIIKCRVYVRVEEASKSHTSWYDRVP